jgi:hypothetical protein
MRRITLLGLLALLLVACGTTAEAPTPLPTAVPPDYDVSDSGWAMTFQHEFPAETFGLGPHRFRYLIHCPVFSAEDSATNWVQFEIVEDAELLSEPIYLRLYGLSPQPLVVSYPASGTFHPDQQFTAVVHYVGVPRFMAEQARTECEILIFWDDFGREILQGLDPYQPTE